MIGRIRLAVALMILVTPLALSAENIRGPLIDLITLDSTSPPQQATVGVDDLLGIQLGTNSRFIKGVELNLSIPAAARQYPNLLGLFLYKKVTPAPSTATHLYSGERASFLVLPATVHAYINIPLLAGALQPSAETITVKPPILREHFPIIAAIIPVAKGLPSDVEKSQFRVSVRPILEDRGLLKLAIREDGKTPAFPFQLSIDNHPETIKPDGYDLASGIHHLQITSAHYKAVNKTFGIDRGQTTTLDIALERLVPTISFEAPDVAQIFLDGKKLDGLPSKPLTVTEGEHTVIIRVGNYSLTKKFSVERGRNYTLSLFLDISVQEN